VADDVLDPRALGRDRQPVDVALEGHDAPLCLPGRC
jgi:hypothetical protein